MQDDGWRLFQLGKGLSAQGHPWRKFGTGSRVSLLESVQRSVMNISFESNANDDSVSGDSEAQSDGGAAGRLLRDKLINWWKSQYCARRMKAVILGSCEWLHE